MLHEGVVLLGSTLGQRLEPVCVVGHAHLHSPLLHACCHGVGYRAVQSCTIVHHVNHGVVDFLRQVLIHLLTCEDVLAEILRGALRGHLHVEGALLERLFYYLES